MSFKGIPPSALAFYVGLPENNTREYWVENKAVYDAGIKAPLTSLGAELAAEFGELQLFSPLRDTRFSKDKVPLKTYQGAVATTPTGCGFYLELSSAGLCLGGGYHARDAAQLARYRDAVSADDSGEQLTAIVRALSRRSFRLIGDSLKACPRGFDRDHPRLELLRQRDLVVQRQHGTPKWLHTAKVLERVRADWEAVRPLNDWLAEHVGPSANPATRWRR